MVEVDRGRYMMPLRIVYQILKTSISDKLGDIIPNLKYGKKSSRSRKPWSMAIPSDYEMGRILSVLTWSSLPHSR